MEQLQYFLERKIKKIPFIQRKKVLPREKNIYIYGVKFSGKTFLIKDYLYQNSNKKILYIDLNDLRLDKERLKKSLQEFIDKNGIEIVAIDNFEENFLLPKAKQIILSSVKKIDLKNFHYINLFTLDFEEYIAFDKSSDIKIVFNNYLKNGSFPEISQISEYKKEERFFEILKLIFEDNNILEIFKEISKMQGHKSSPYHIFTKIKNRFKISKDRFYHFFEDLKNRQIIFTLKKYSFPNASKKIYLCDFALKNYLTFDKEFPKIFENMIYLELIKKDYEIFYYDMIDFYIPKTKEIIFSIPFGNEVTIQKKVDKAYKYITELNVNKIKVVSVINSFKFYQKDISVEVLPFYEWATGL